MPELAARVEAVRAAFPAYADMLRLAHDYIPTDAAASLTKSRTVVELVVLELYAALMGKEPKKGELGALLADNQFTRRFDRRIRERMDGVRAMGNVGTHGDPVRPSDAERALDDVCEVLLWYREHRGAGEPAGACPPAGCPVSPPEALPAARAEEGPGAGGVGVLAGTARIELHIDGDLDSFTPQKQERVLRAIRELLSAAGDIRVVSKRSGSVRLTLELTAEQAEELLWAVRGGRLREVGVVGAELIDPGRPANLEQFLPPPGSPLRPPALHALIASDLETRWRRGQRVALEHYLEKYPELGAAPPAGLVYEEYRVRHRYGDRPPLGQYRQRFPGQFAELVRLAKAAAGGPDASPPTARSPGPRGGERSGGDAGGYRLIRRLGAGAFGEVWLGEAPGGTQVAVKVIQRPLDPKEARQGLEVLEQVMRLRHPHLAQTHAFVPAGERLHIVMELADGSLQDRARQCRERGEPGIPRDELLRYFGEGAEALDYLHSQGIHHRDLKPANILLVGGHVKLADFGLARSLSAQKSMHDMTACGTPAYMGPEVWHGQIHSNTDQWSLAAAYAELRLGRPLLGGADLPTVMSRTLTGDFDLAPLPEAEQRVLRKALAVDPRDRYPSCRAFVGALEEAARGAGPGPPVASRDAPPAGGRRPGAPAAPQFQRPGGPAEGAKTRPEAPADPGRQLRDAAPAPPVGRPTGPELGGRSGPLPVVRGEGGQPRRVPEPPAWRGPVPAASIKGLPSSPPRGRNRGWLVLLLLAVLAVLVAIVVYKAAF